MSQTSITQADKLKLPRNVVSKLDVARLLAEFEQIDSQLDDAAIRQKVGATVSFESVMSEQLADFMSLNQLALSDSNLRDQVVTGLRTLKDEAPVVHMTFAAAVDQESLGQIIDWLRQSVHPQCLLIVGLQPNLVGGVYVRTPNHVHDLSLRGQLAKSRHLLVEAVEAVNAGR